MAGNILEWLGRLPAAVLYLAAFGLAFGEAAFLLDFVVPGEVGLVVAGAAGKEKGLALPLLCALGAIGAVAGDSVSWLVGKRFGTKLVDRWEWTRRTVKPRLDRAHETLEHKGGVAIFLARFVGALRALVPLVAGTAGVRYRTVLLWDAPAAAIWGTAMVCLGWFLGEHVAELVDRYGGYLSLVVVGAIVAFVGVRWVRRRGRGGG